MAQTLTFLIACVAAGILARRTGRLPAATPHVLNRLVLDLALPALALVSIHALALEPRLLVAAGMLWVIFLLAWAVFPRLPGFSRAEAGAAVLTAGLCNTAFLGLPMIEGL